jgi:D-arabinose 1-dehydrogenase-like Zn-dependent alcohol dehydrogenase
VPADAYGGYAEYCIGPTAMTFEMPDDMSDADASAFFMPFHLAWLGLEHRARVQPGETVLVPVDTWVGKGLAARVDGDKAEHRSPYLGTTMSHM